MTAGYLTNGYGPTTPPDTEIVGTCRFYCGAEVVGNIGDNLYDACEEHRPYAAMDHEQLVARAVEQDDQLDHLADELARLRGAA